MNIHRSSFKLFVDIEINRMELFLFLFFFFCYPSTSRGASSIINYKIVVRPIIKKNLITRHSYRILTRILSWRHAINRIQWYSTEKFFPNISKTKANRRIQFIYEKKRNKKQCLDIFQIHFQNHITLALLKHHSFPSNTTNGFDNLLTPPSFHSRFRFAPLALMNHPLRERRE